MAKPVCSKSADMVELPKISVLNQKVIGQGVLSDKTCQMDSENNMEKVLKNRFVNQKDNVSQTAKIPCQYQIISKSEDKYQTNSFVSKESDPSDNEVSGVTELIDIEENDSDIENVDDDRDADFVLEGEESDKNEPFSDSNDSDNKPFINKVLSKRCKLLSPDMENNNSMQQTKKEKYEELMKKKKSKGEEYITRKGIVKPAKEFELDQFLAGRIKFSKKKVERKSQDTKTRKRKNRDITVSYFATLSGTEIKICKTMSQKVHSITRGKIDFIVQKKPEVSHGNSYRKLSGATSVFVKRDATELGQNIRWHDIKVLRFLKDLGFGIIKVKYLHDEDEQFTRLNIKRRGKHDSELKPIYSGPKSINPKKKESLDIDPFYKNLNVNESTIEDII
ncbi:unnamed protein product [Psylliodes chrysocephalus]|uniref:Uncharacterized protein n=1 Tax=Psylliodes chrysocephalus TaxID=3402493 RepID=A0A9P0GC19_9CUCU|nr:unnamed protein product [Psylliodes chrysocephala]